jgi:hypothetical protein
MAFQQELAAQSWALYGIGMFLIVVRTYVAPVLTIRFMQLSNNITTVVLHDGVAYEVFHDLQSMTG